MKTTIFVQNLKCGGCIKTITSKISELPNIENVTVEQETAAVSFSAGSEQDALLVKEKLRSLGYPEMNEENGMMSKAKSFVSCATGKMK